MNPQTIAVFPDTNLFLHYRPVNEIDWCALVKARPVEVKIAPVVPHELEEQRVLHQLRKIRDRAGTAIKLLQTYLQKSQVRDGVTLQFLVNEPTPEYAAARNLNLVLADDRLIGAYLLYREANPDVRCIVVTNDLPLTIRLTQRQIEFISLDESLLLPSDPDRLEKKNRQLEGELLRYKSREPDLAIKFEDEENYVRFRLSSPTNTPDPEPDIQAKLAAAKEKCKPVELAPQLQPVDPNDPFAGIAEQIRQITTGFQIVGREFYEDYNRRVEKYYRDYEKYLRDAARFKTLPTSTITLNLILHNSGTCPAEDIHILLHFPDGFLVYDGRRPPKPPEEPAVPSKEISLMPSFAGFSGLSLADITRMPSLPDPTLPKIRKTKSYEVTFQFEKLQHGFIRRLRTLYVLFDSVATAASFSIDYTIHAGNMIDKCTAQLGVIIEKV